MTVLTSPKDGQAAPSAGGAKAGRAARRETPRAAHGKWGPPTDRFDPIEVLERQAATRVPELLPIRHGRMLSSPFAFYRGAAAVMVNDLALAPSSGIVVQLCGDAHAANFGLFASPERQMVFDVNDFDETSKGPFEWDLKRLVASLAVAGRDAHMSAAQRELVVSACARSYRLAMAEFAAMGNLEVWYARLDANVIRRWQSQLASDQLRRVKRQAAKARVRGSARALARLTTDQDGEVRFRSDPPLLVPMRELVAGEEAESFRAGIEDLIAAYAASLRPELRTLLSGYRIVDLAHKVVGVGSVGLRAWVILMLGRGDEPLVLQAKEAEASVLEPFAGESPFANHGERVVIGQRTMQASSDVFLGWLRSEVSLDGRPREFYLRQLWDWKGSIDPALLQPSGLRVYGEMCAWTLARAHARSGDPAAIAAYLGRGGSFDTAMSRFAERYADQNAGDYAALKEAVESGRLAARTDL